MSEELGELLHFDEEIPHVDEKWLVSYADMMTLLFGFFVMMYSMASKMDVVQKSMAEKFTPKADEQPVAPAMNNLGNIEDLTAKVAGLETALAEAKARAAAMEKSASDMEDKLFEQSSSLLKEGQIATELKAMKEERDKLRGMLAKANTNALLEVARKDNVESVNPASGESDKKSPAGGGGMGGGGNRGSKERIGGSGGVKVRMPVQFENGSSSTTVGMTNRGFVISSDAPGEPGDSMVATIQGNDGRSVRVVLKIKLEHGDRRHLGVVHFLSGNEQILKDWIANAP